MAESVFSYLAPTWDVDSAGTSNEEEGNPPHPGTQQKLAKEHIPLVPHRARQVSQEDYDAYDLIVYMDEQNRRSLLRIFGGDPKHKLHALLEFAPKSYREERLSVADPWWTGNFDLTYDDILAGCKGILKTYTNT